jgi:DNA-binding transcriptional regulator YiaG
MSADEFKEWLKTMKISGAKAARLLGVHVNTVTKYKRRGAPDHVALACTALYHRLGKWKALD